MIYPTPDEVGLEVRDGFSAVLIHRALREDTSEARQLAYSWSSQVAPLNDSVREKLAHQYVEIARESRQSITAFIPKEKVLPNGKVIDGLSIAVKAIVAKIPSITYPFPQSVEESDMARFAQETGLLISGTEVDVVVGALNRRIDADRTQGDDSMMKFHQGVVDEIARAKTPQRS